MPMHLGQYSKFVRPGYVMTGANNNPTSGVYVTSYKGNNNYVIVAVNSNGGSSTLLLTITGATVTSVTPYQTSASNQIAQLSAVSVSNERIHVLAAGTEHHDFCWNRIFYNGTPSFTLAPSASTLSVTGQQRNRHDVTVTPENAFTGSVSFTATGLPSGVTASFSPTSSTTSSVLTLTASSTATTGGPVTITITGTSGSTTASTTIALTVNAKTTSGFSLNPSAPSLSVNQGATGNRHNHGDGYRRIHRERCVCGNRPSQRRNCFVQPDLFCYFQCAHSDGRQHGHHRGLHGDHHRTSGSTTASTTFTLAVGSSGGGACTVDYTISPQNSSQFGASITIKNGGTTTLSNWVLTWTFANGQTIASSWNGAATQSGANVTVSEQSGQSWENIPASGSYSGFGFNGTWNGITNAVPAAFSLNGTACTVN
jgi:hypothetical protein